MGKHEKYMDIALSYADKAFKLGEVPVGAVIIDEDHEIIGWGYNDREATQDATRHAEIIAIQMATKSKQSWRLEGCTLYVTLEPCPMCCGAIIQSRIPSVIFGATDPKGGAVGSIVNLLDNTKFNHRPTVVIQGVRETQCSQILKDFFLQLRK